MPNNKQRRSTTKKEAGRATTGAKDVIRDEKGDMYMRFSSDLTCYHGSEENAFTPGSEENYFYLQNVDQWMRQYNKEMMKCNNTMQVFDISSETENGKVLATILSQCIDDIGFPKFLIAFCAEAYMKDPNGWLKLMPLLFVACKLKFEQGFLDVNQFRIWFREMRSQRGFVKSLAEAMPCDCLKHEKKEAKKHFDRIMGCSHCRKVLPRDQLSMCSGCRLSLYCGRKCQKKAWPVHKEDCKRISSMNNGGS